MDTILRYKKKNNNELHITILHNNDEELYSETSNFYDLKNIDYFIKNDEYIYKTSFIQFILFYVNLYSQLNSSITNEDFSINYKYISKLEKKLYKSNRNIIYFNNNHNSNVINLIRNDDYIFIFNNNDNLVRIVSILDNLLSPENIKSIKDNYYQLYELFMKDFNLLYKDNNLDLNYYLFKNKNALVSCYNILGKYNWDIFNILFSNLINNNKLPSFNKIFKPLPIYIKNIKKAKYIHYEKLKDYLTIINYLIENNNINELSDMLLYSINPIYYELCIIAMSQFNIFSFNKLSLSNDKIDIYDVENNDYKLVNKFKQNYLDLCNNNNDGNNNEDNDKTLKDDVLLYHGSSISNWYSILSNGLYTPSNSNYLMANANAYGPGIYLSNDMQMSYSYCRNNTKTKIIGVFQVLNGIRKYFKTESIFVVNDSSNLILTHILIIKCENYDMTNSLYKPLSNLLHNRYKPTDIQKSNKIVKIDNNTFKSCKKIVSSSTKRLLKEIKLLHTNNDKYDSDLKFKYIFTIPNDKDMEILHFKIPIDNFKTMNDDNESPIYKDMKKYKYSEILLEVRINDKYPFEPPFVRIIKPRFKYLTGHITIGGSICMDILIKQHWVPSCKLSNLIYLICNTIIKGEARLDASRHHINYTYDEALSAFKRMFNTHKEW
jgi:ubiquitin-protein ligase